MHPRPGRGTFLDLLGGSNRCFNHRNHPAFKTPKRQTLAHWTTGNDASPGVFLAEGTDGAVPRGHRLRPVSPVGDRPKQPDKTQHFPAWPTRLGGLHPSPFLQDAVDPHPMPGGDRRGHPLVLRGTPPNIDIGQTQLGLEFRPLPVQLVQGFLQGFGCPCCCAWFTRSSWCRWPGCRGLCWGRGLPGCRCIPPHLVAIQDQVQPPMNQAVHHRSRRHPQLDRS